MFERLKQMLRKEFIEIFRDPRMKAIIFVVPIVQVLLFGYAVTTDVRHIRAGIYDLDNSIQSRDLFARFSASGYFDIVARPMSDASVRNLLDHGDVKTVLRVNRGFGADIVGGKTAQLQIILDGTDSNTASFVLNYAGQITADYSEFILVQNMQRATGQRPPPAPVTAVSRAWFNPNLESRNFFVPGVIALLVMVISILLSSMAIVREKEIGTIEQIMVTPIGRLEFMLGKTIPFALIGYLDVLLISVVAVYWFEIPILGDLWLLFLCTGLYLMSTLGVGLFISTISGTQQQAMMTAFFFMQPAILLSGFIYPIANMPQVIQWSTYLNPLRYFLIILRGIFLKGVGVSVLWPQMLALAILGIALLVLSSARFRKTLS